MVKTVPKNYGCVRCERKQYTNEKCFGCGGKVFVDLKNSSQRNEAKTIDELISIALWSIRRLPTNSLKHYALHDLKKAVGDSHKYSEFIDKCMGDVPID